MKHLTPESIHIYFPEQIITATIDVSMQNI